MRILLVGDQQVGGFHHHIRQMEMQVQFGANHHIRPDHFADLGEQFALAVVAAVGDHRAVQIDQHDIQWHCGLDPCNNLVPEFLVEWLCTVLLAGGAQALSP